VQVVYTDDVMRRSLIATILCAGAICVARADVTLRYSFDVKPGAAMPPQAIEAMKSQVQNLPGVMTRLKGSKAFAAVMGFNAITDFDGGVDHHPGSERQAVRDRIERRVRERRRQASRTSPRSAQIDGRHEDRRSGARHRAHHGDSRHPGGGARDRFGIEMPAGPHGPPRAMRMVYSTWVPRSDEIIRHPALQELAEYAARAYAGMNPADMMQKMFGQAPGMGERMRAVMDEFKNSNVMLEAAQCTCRQWQP
jgi:hypothetical protein